MLLSLHQLSQILLEVDRHRLVLCYLSETSSSKVTFSFYPNQLSCHHQYKLKRLRERVKKIESFLSFFFLIQTISKINIHIFQYSMIGIALIMFYTLLISITEHSTFSFAYLIAGASVIIMISLYSISILKDRKFPTFIGISLSVLYTFIYVIIQLEDYALLVGSIGLFLILAAVMYFSRKIEWNK